MVYITVKQSPRYRQMTFEDFLSTEFSPEDLSAFTEPAGSDSDTVTNKYSCLPKRIRDLVSVRALKAHLRDFCYIYARLIVSENRKLDYETFYRAKSEKGLPFFVKSLFKTQGRYVECNYHAVYAGIIGILRPLLKKHETDEHEAIFEDVKNKVFALLTSNGFDVSRIDFGSVLKSAFRRIDAPKPRLSQALNYLKADFETYFHASHHTSAFAYVHKRSTIDCIKRHQANESKWFAKFDLSNFFNSTTPDFLMKQLSMIFPFSEVVRDEEGKELLEKALSLCFLDGSLPQGTPISPMLTNLMMIPIDHALANDLRDFGGQRYVYTRYADDFIITSRYQFNVKKLERKLVDTLSEFGAPFTVNESKTRYGSVAGSNWNLGLMLNKDNQITVGWKNIKNFKTKLFQYVMDRQSDHPWSPGEIRELDGLRNYYSMVEKDVIEKEIKHMNGLLGVDIRALMRQDLRA